MHIVPADPSFFASASVAFLLFLSYFVKTHNPKTTWKKKENLRTQGIDISLENLNLKIGSNLNSSFI